MTRDKLREALAESLGRTATELVRLAWIVRLLEERGEDLTDLKLDLVPTLRMIAYGQLSPEFVVRHGQSVALMRIARGMPIVDQERLAKGERVLMAVQQPDGSFDQQMADPSLMSSRQLAQVFDRGRIRSIEEQILVIRDQRKKPPKPRHETVGQVTAVGDGLIVKGVFIPKADVVAALSLMARPGEPDEDDDELPGRRPFVIQLTEAQYERLKRGADMGKTKMAPLVRRALTAYGLI